jgi:hypothetical protein
MSLPEPQFVHLVNENDSLLHMVTTNILEHFDLFKASLIEEKLDSEALLVNIGNKKHLEIKHTPARLDETEASWLLRLKLHIFKYENRNLKKVEMNLREELGQAYAASCTTFPEFLMAKYREAVKSSNADRYFMFDFPGDDFSRLVLYGSAIQVRSFHELVVSPELARLKSSLFFTKVEAVPPARTYATISSVQEAVKEFKVQQFFKQYNVLYNFQGKFKIIFRIFFSNILCVVNRS